jgi:C-terminal processing protease CtpA/Prc
MISWQRLILIGCVVLLLPFAGWSDELSVEATRAGARADQELILRWKGRPVEEALAPLIARAYASTPGMARRLAIEKLPYGQLGQTIRVTLKGTNGVEAERELRYESDSEPDPPPLELTWPEKGIAYLALRTFDVRRSAWQVKKDGPANASGLPAAAVEGVQANISEAFSQCADAKALILDLRGNGGGSDRDEGV